MAKMTESRFVQCLGRALRGSGVVVVAVLAAGFVSGAWTARAQGTSDPNPGALTFTGGMDVPSVYVFRGIVQEADPKITLFPYGDIGIALVSGGGGFKSVAVNFGVWNSIHTGSAGSDGPSRHAHYEEDFYTTLNLGFGGGVGVGVTYLTLTSPNFMFDTIKELQFKITKAHKLNPYGFLAFELTDVQADLGDRKGSYLELGVGPSFSLGPKVALTIPAKVGLSLKDYYELNGEDQRFGFFDVGGLITIPLSGASSRFGAWNVHGGADVFAFGDMTKTANRNKSSKVVALVGIGLAY